MRVVLSTVLLLLALLPGLLNAASSEPVNARSQSGAFLVRGVPLGPPPSGYATGAVQYLRLDPTLTAVSLERIRDALLTELALKDQWRSLITVQTRPVEEDDAPVQINSVRFKDGWGYRVEIPERVGKDIFVRTAVKVVILELANRSTLTREAELPPWLGEGLAAHLQSSVLSTLALEPETITTGRPQRHDPLQTAREVLRRRPSLNFDDLCLPAPEMLAPQNIETFRACSQILVQELLRLRGGREAMREFIQRLPENLNWQTTFLQSFRGHFEKLIDADKWYSLTVANAAARDLLSRWPLAASWKQLDDILLTRVQVRMQAGELPIETSATLQRILTEWDEARQRPVLEQKVAALQALLPRIASELGDLTAAYLEVVQAHLAGQSPKLSTATELPPEAAYRQHKVPRRTRLILRHLDALDTRREALRQGK